MKQFLGEFLCWDSLELNYKKKKKIEAFYDFSFTREQKYKLGKKSKNGMEKLLA